MISFNITSDLSLFEPTNESISISEFLLLFEIFKLLARFNATDEIDA